MLPFADMSEQHDEEYFPDGLSEGLIDHLAHAADLKGIARSSVSSMAHIAQCQSEAALAMMNKETDPQNPVDLDRPRHRQS